MFALVRKNPVANSSWDGSRNSASVAGYTRHCAVGGGHVGVAGDLCDHRGQVAARAVAHDADPAGLDRQLGRVVVHPAVGRDRVVDRGGEGVLRGEAVVDRRPPRTRSRARAGGRSRRGCPGRRRPSRHRAGRRSPGPARAGPCVGRCAPGCRPPGRGSDARSRRCRSRSACPARRPAAARRVAARRSRARRRRAHRCARRARIIACTLRLSTRPSRTIGGAPITRSITGSGSPRIPDSVRKVMPRRTAMAAQGRRPRSCAAADRGRLSGCGGSRRRPASVRSRPPRSRSRSACAAPGGRRRSSRELFSAIRWKGCAQVSVRTAPCSRRARATVLAPGPKPRRVGVAAQADPGAHRHRRRATSTTPSLRRAGHWNWSRSGRCRTRWRGRRRRRAPRSAARTGRSSASAARWSSCTGQSVVSSG